MQTCDGIARAYVTGEARKAGADEATLKEVEKAVALQAGPRDLMVTHPPEVAASLGLDATSSPTGCAFPRLGTSTI